MPSPKISSWNFERLGYYQRRSECDPPWLDNGLFYDRILTRQRLSKELLKRENVEGLLRCGNHRRFVVMMMLHGVNYCTVLREEVLLVIVFLTKIENL
jgi:hypothetical protein